jgi:hypothetical protein
VVLPFASNIPLTNPQVMTPPFAIDPTLTALAGTANPNTAPEIAAPDIGGHAGIIDVGNFSGSDITGDGGVGAQYYKFTIATAGDYTFTMDWNNDADLDPVVCFDAACSDGAFAGTGTDQPEQGTLTLQPGTYYFAVVLFAQGASATNPDFFSLQIDAAPPSPPEGGLRAPVSTKSLHSGRVHLVRNGAS